MHTNIWQLMKKLFIVFLFLFIPSNTFAQQGCCSWHGGIDYCDISVGRYVCEDGAYSPTCTCGGFAYEEPDTQWCGAGEWFSTEFLAKQSLDNYYKDAQADKICPYCPPQKPVPNCDGLALEEKIKYSDQNLKSLFIGFSIGGILGFAIRSGLKSSNH